MTLIIKHRPEFEATVHINTAHLRGSFNARWVALPGTEIDRLQTEASAQGKGSQALLQHVCTWFETVQVPGGEIAHGEPDALARLLDWPGIGPAMVKTYFNALWEEASGN